MYEPSLLKALAVAVSVSPVLNGCVGATPSAGSLSGATGKSSSPVSRAVANVGAFEPVSTCGLPETRNTAVRRPAGTPANLTVLDWAGFDAAVSWSYDDGQASHIEHYAALQATGV